MNIKKFLINVLIFLFRVLATTKRIVAVLFYAVCRPFGVFLRLVFYKFIVKGYCFYISFLKKVGWYKFKGNFISFLINYRTVHFVVGALTLIIVFTNLATDAQAISASEQAQETMISKLITSEFGEHGQESDLTKETIVDSSIHYNVNNRYLGEQAVLKSQGGVDPDLGRSAESNGFMSSVVPEKQIVAGPGIATSAAETIQQSQREDVVTYVVKSGDTIGTIASKFGISVNTVLWENDLSAYDMIRPGDELRILPVSGVTHEVGRGETLSYLAGQYDVSASKIAEANDIKEAGSLQIGQELIIPGGKRIESGRDTSQVATKETSNQGSRSGASVIRDIVKPDKKEQVPSNKMAWPTQGHRITQYYSWRHHGLDIANDVGTPLYSSDVGVVQYVGWSQGYGNNIIIDHGGGKQTRYAHLSQFHCNSGDSVDKGEVIGAMGNTGWSTGPHLHFEVIINGKKYNPLNYIR